MIIYHQNNIAAFAGGHVVYWFGQPLFGYRISKTLAAGGTILPQIVSAYHRMNV